MTRKETQDLGRKVTRGAGLLVMLRVVDRLLGLASFAVLARLLVPDDFGLFALALSVLAIVELLGQAGIDIVLIQRRNADRPDYDTAWTLGILIGAATALIVLGAAGATSVLGADPRVGPILYWLALASLVGGFANPGVVDFQKHFEFGKEFRYSFLTRLFRIVLTIVFAFAWREVWALVAGYVAGTGIRVLLSFLMHPYRPRLSLASASRFFGFSGWLLLRNVATGLADHVTNLIVGLHSGAAALGFFTAGRAVANLATSELQAPIRRALFPSIVELNEDLPRLRQHYLNAIGVIAIVTLPIPAGVALMAHDIVLLLFGDRWLAAVPLIQILALAGVLKGILSGGQLLLIGLGRPRRAASLALFRFLVMLPTVAAGTVAAGAVGAAWGLVASSAVMLTVNARYALGALDISYRDLAATVARPLAATGLMTAAIQWIVVTPPVSAAYPEAAALANVVITVVLGGAVYGAALLGIWCLARRPAGAERFVLDYMSARMARLRPLAGS